MKKKTVLIGLGTIARHHSLGLRESALFDLVAVCDQNPDAVSRLCYPDLPFYEDARQMLAEIEPEVAVIATSPASHSLLVSLCSEYGVFALVEKPLATNQEDSEKMLSMLRQNRHFAQKEKCSMRLLMNTLNRAKKPLKKSKNLITTLYIHSLTSRG